MMPIPDTDAERLRPFPLPFGVVDIEQFDSTLSDSNLK